MHLRSLTVPLLSVIRRKTEITLAPELAVEIPGFFTGDHYSNQASHTVDVTELKSFFRVKLKLKTAHRVDDDNPDVGPLWSMVQNHGG